MGSRASYYLNKIDGLQVDLPTWKRMIDRTYESLAMGTFHAARMPCEEVQDLAWVIIGLKIYLTSGWLGVEDVGVRVSMLRAEGITAPNYQTVHSGQNGRSGIGNAAGATQVGNGGTGARIRPGVGPLLSRENSIADESESESSHWEDEEEDMPDLEALINP
jgi:hypothetical protein